MRDNCPARECGARPPAAATRPPSSFGILVNVVPPRMHRQGAAPALACGAYVLTSGHRFGKRCAGRGGLHGGSHPACDPAAGRADDSRDGHGVALRARGHLLRLMLRTGTRRTSGASACSRSPGHPSGSTGPWRTPSSTGWTTTRTPRRRGGEFVLPRPSEPVQGEERPVDTIGELRLCAA